MRLVLRGFIIGAIACSVHADITFDFFDSAVLYGTLDDQAGPLSYTNSGIVATFTASDGSMNRTTGGFGLNSSSDSDDTDAFDLGEWLDITFDQAVTFTGLNVSSWNAGMDEASIFVEGRHEGLVTATGDHVFNIYVEKDEVLRLSSTSGVLGNGWSLNSMDVVAVPEPVTITLLGAGGVVMWVLRRSSRS